MRSRALIVGLLLDLWYTYDLKPGKHRLRIVTRDDADSLERKAFRHRVCHYLSGKVTLGLRIVDRKFWIERTVIVSPSIRQVSQY